MDEIRAKKSMLIEGLVDVTSALMRDSNWSDIEALESALSYRSRVLREIEGIDQSLQGTPTDLDPVWKSQLSHLQEIDAALKQRIESQVRHIQEEVKQQTDLKIGIFRSEFAHSKGSRVEVKA